MLKQNLFLLFFPSLLLTGCIKDKDYKYSSVYTQELKVVTMNLSPTSLPADGASKSTVTIQILPKDDTDSLTLSQLGMTLTTSNGSLAVSSGTSAATIAIAPAYTLDATTQKRMLTATATLTSSTRPDPSVALTLKYLGVQQTQNLEFSSVDPNKIKLTVSSLSIAPNFTREDSLTVQLSSKTGLPSQGMPIGLDAYDELYQHKLGFFRVKPATADAAGTGKFIFVLGDNTINGVNYTGTVHLVAYWTGSPTTVADTVNVFSRN